MAPDGGALGGARSGGTSGLHRHRRGATRPHPPRARDACAQTVVVPKLAPLQRTITEHLQGARDAAGGSFQKSELGRRMSERAQSSVKEQKLEPWEKEIVAQLVCGRRLERRPSARALL